MKNKIKFKKAIIFSLCIVLIWITIFIIFNIYQYKIYTNNFNDKLGCIIEKILINYPNIEKNELVEILNNTNLNDKDILREYGIDLEKDSAVLENQEYLKKFVTINIIILILFSASLLAIFLIYNSSKDKRLNQITKYIEQINKKNYKLDIDDNTEDELSILKNEIYKITIMLKEQAENSMKDKLNLKDSLSDISHQLKTPITSITIMLDNIIDNPNMDEKIKREFIKDIKREITNINFLVQALLKLSKFDANTINFINKNVKVYDIINEAIKNVSTLCDLKNVQIVVKGNKEDTIKCDIKWQVEAITNILKNSVEYSENSGKVQICYNKNKLYTEIKIIDNGKGIEETEIPHIFERFYKGKNSSRESIGIGLALAKTIIEQNNGKISVESKTNRETIFTIKYFEI